MIALSLQTRPKGLIGLLIMTLSLLAFHVTCNIYAPRYSTSLKSSPSHLPLVTLDHVSIDELDLRLIQSSISDLSRSISQINDSLASLHEKINDEVLRRPQCHQALDRQTTDAEIFGSISFVLFMPFLGGIAIILFDASNVSEGYLLTSILRLLGSANAGLVFMLFLRRYYDGMWYDYVLGMTWPMVISGFLVSPENSGKLATEAGKAAKE